MTPAPPRRPALLAASLGLSILAFLALAPPALAQCAMCQTALTGSAEGRGMAGHLNAAIVVMFVSPYLVAASFAFVMFRRAILRALGSRLEAARGRLALLAARPALGQRPAR